MNMPIRLGTHATKVYTSDDGETIVMYHQTPIVRFNDEKIILDTGKWRSRLLKERMNEASGHFNLGYRVWESTYAWHVDWHNDTIMFHDGMELKRDIPNTDIQNAPTQ